MKAKESVSSPDTSESSSPVNPAQHQSTNRQQMISDAAYFRAESRGFQPMNDLEDWLDAEADIDRHLI
jgi:hypothetical protein